MNIINDVWAKVASCTATCSQLSTIRKTKDVASMSSSVRCELAPRSFTLGRSPFPGLRPGYRTGPVNGLKQCCRHELDRWPAGIYELSGARPDSTIRGVGCRARWRITRCGLKLLEHRLLPHRQHATVTVALMCAKIRSRPGLPPHWRGGELIVSSRHGVGDNIVFSAG